MSDIPDMLKNLYFFREVVSSLLGECPWYMRGFLKRKLASVDKAIDYHERRNDQDVIEANYKCRITVENLGKVVWLDQVRDKK